MSCIIISRYGYGPQRPVLQSFLQMQPIDPMRIVLVRINACAGNSKCWSSWSRAGHTYGFSIHSNVAIISSIIPRCFFCHLSPDFFLSLFGLFGQCYMSRRASCLGVVTVVFSICKFECYSYSSTAHISETCF